MSHNENDSNNSENVEQEEILMYRKKAEDVVSFIMVYDLRDLESPFLKKHSFKPDMSHQIFGESESIFGYKNVSINLYYLHNSARCWADVKYSGKIKNELCKPDDIMGLLNPWLTENYRTKKEDFIEDLNNETNIIYGEVIDEFTNTVNDLEKDIKTKYKVTFCDTNNEEFKSFHQRFETLIIWFIDGANYIDLDNPRWLIFYLYEEKFDEKTKKTIYSPIGYCTVYKFYLYPDSERPRISQFFILPTHQKRGLGTKFYGCLFNYLKNLTNVADITVEEPTPILQKLRDYSDSLLIINELEKLKETQGGCYANQKQINEILRKHKICKSQCQRVKDILAFLAALKGGNKLYTKFLKDIKTRIANDIERNTSGSKKICNMERAGLNVKSLDKESDIEIEFKKYIESIRAPVNRLKESLSVSG